MPNNRVTRYLSSPLDVFYRDFMRDYIQQTDLKNPFAVTLTMNSVQWRSHSQNFRHFMNRLNQSFLKSGYRRYGKRLTVIPIIEGTRDVRPHYHCIIDNPFPERDREFVNTLKESWNKTLLGQSKVQVEPMESNKWISYITKLSSKSDIRESVDWENISLPPGGEVI